MGGIWPITIITTIIISKLLFSYNLHEFIEIFTCLETWPMKIVFLFTSLFEFMLAILVIVCRFDIVLCVFVLTQTTTSPSPEPIKGLMENLCSSRWCCMWTQFINSYYIHYMTLDASSCSVFLNYAAISEWKSTVSLNHQPNSFSAHANLF